MTELYLIRHAQALVNAGTSDQIASDATSGLTQQGHVQARRLAEWMVQHIRPAVLYASPLLRAVQTARPIHDLTGLPICIDEDLAELRLNLPDGAPPEAAQAGWLRARRAPHSPAFPAGESLAELYQRASTAVETIARAYPDQKIVVVTHGGVIEMVFFHFFGIPLERNLWSFIQIDYTAVFHWRSFQVEEVSGWQLVSLNDTRHLGGRSGV